MVDKLTSARRSWNMSRIRGKNTQPEIAVRKLLHRLGYRFRLHTRNLPGRPDIVLPKFKTVIFVHGCFWHGHKGCRYFVVPKSRTEWWVSKIKRNKELDEINAAKLREMGWRVVEIYECQLKKAVIGSTEEWLLTELLGEV